MRLPGGSDVSRRRKQRPSKFFAGGRFFTVSFCIDPMIGDDRLSRSPQIVIHSPQFGVQNAVGVGEASSLCLFLREQSEDASPTPRCTSTSENEGSEDIRKFRRVKAFLGY